MPRKLLNHRELIYLYIYTCSYIINRQKQNVTLTFMAKDQGHKAKAVVWSGFEQNYSVDLTFIFKSTIIQMRLDQDISQILGCS